MPERPAVDSRNLTKKQFYFLGRKLGCFSKRPVLDLGSDGTWTAEVAGRGGAIQGIVDQAADDLPEVITVGSPTGSISQDVHSIHRILVRDLSLFENNEVTPETTIALANLLSCLKPRGRMAIPIADPEGTEHQLWTERLQGFPGRLTTRVYKTGLFDKLTLMFLFRGKHEIPVLEFTVERKPISRLEWHKLAREIVMQRMQKSPAAA